MYSNVNGSRPEDAHPKAVIVTELTPHEESNRTGFARR